MSGLLGLKIVRCRYSSFHARYPFLRWPLDNLFHSVNFSHDELRTLPEIASENAEKVQDEHKATEVEKEKADDKIQEVFLENAIDLSI